MILLLGMPKWYIISQMNSTVLAAVMEATNFTLIHFVNLSTTIKMCVNPLLGFLNGTTRSSHHAEKAR
jgi:hypothetical protein